MSRLSIEISSEQHQKIKALAALQGRSMKDFILSKLFESNTDDEDTAMTELEELLLARIVKLNDENQSSKTIQEITNSVLKKAKH